MNFTPKPCGNTLYAITENTEIIIAKSDISEYVKRMIGEHKTKKTDGAVPIKSITFTLGIPSELREKKTGEKEKSAEGAVFGERIKVSEDESVGNSGHEQYAIVFAEQTEVYAEEEDGFIIALSTIMHLSDSGEITDGTIYDFPDVTERYYRIYMPGRESLCDFERMLDLLVYYKYNAIILEIGGAMEYERHPRINEKWVEFCREISRYSGRCDEIQYGEHWKKNSIHYENGDGSYLTKDECRTIVGMCKERGIEIIPECPTLSHTDYICLAYPELAERDNDPYPDTYCPSNPESYKVVFDVLDEVIEVFEPKRINIGHDEFYTVGICKRCQGKDPSAVYADDVKKIKDYLKERGISTMMWAEKLLKARYNYSGFKVGGWYDESDCNGVKFQVPDMWRCADLLPKDITYIHWYWEFGEHLDDEFHARELPVIFGNFSGLRCQNYRVRIGRGVKGAAVSNWGSFNPEYMQRNLQYFNLISTAYVLNSHSYTDADRESIIKATYKKAYETYKTGIRHPLTVIHSVDHNIKYKPFWCGIFIEDEIYLLGHYRITYKDGREALLPVKFGTNIGPVNNDPNTSSCKELSYSTLPIEGEGGYVYEHVYENPYPNGQISSIEYIPSSGKETILPKYKFMI